MTADDWTITGTSRVFGILADPIAQVRTPQVINAAFREHGIDAVLVPFHVGRDHLAAFFPAIVGMKNFGGLIVTVPHKGDIPGLSTHSTDQAALVGAANVVRRNADGSTTCTMFDGVGFVAGLVAEGHDPAGKRVLLAGAGGAAGAVAFALADRGVAELVITNRTEAKAAAVAERVAAAYPAVTAKAGPPDPTGFDIVVNATSLGMKEGDALPLDADRLSPEQTVAEVIMKPVITPIIARAQQAGCTIHLGAHMLDQQVKLMLDFFNLVPLAE